MLPEVLQNDSFYELFISCQSMHSTELKSIILLYLVNHIMLFNFSNKTNSTYSKAFMLFIFELKLLQAIGLQHIDLINGQ